MTGSLSFFIKHEHIDANGYVCRMVWRMIIFRECLLMVLLQNLPLRSISLISNQIPMRFHRFSRFATRSAFGTG